MHTEINLKWLFAVLAAMLTVVACQPAAPDLTVGQIVGSTQTIQAGEQITVAVSAAGGANIQYKWEATAGTFADPTKSSTNYTAPTEEGAVTITVTVSSGDQSESKVANFQVIVPPATPTTVPTDMPVPTLAATETELPSISLGTAPEIQSGGQEFYFDVREYGDGINLVGYTLEVTLQGGDGKDAQLFFKECSNFNSVYSFSQKISSGVAMRFSPATEPKEIDEFSDFSKICAVGVKVFGGVEGITVVNARLTTAK